MLVNIGQCQIWESKKKTSQNMKFDECTQTQRKKEGRKLFALGRIRKCLKLETSFFLSIRHLKSMYKSRHCNIVNYNILIQIDE